MPGRDTGGGEDDLLNGLEFGRSEMKTTKSWPGFWDNLIPLKGGLSGPRGPPRAPASAAACWRMK